jgi:hypothetical protein
MLLLKWVLLLYLAASLPFALLMPLVIQFSANVNVAGIMVLVFLKLLLNVWVKTMMALMGGMGALLLQAQEAILPLLVALLAGLYVVVHVILAL